MKSSELTVYLKFMARCCKNLINNANFLFYILYERKGQANFCNSSQWSNTGPHEPLVFESHNFQGHKTWKFLVKV